LVSGKYQREEAIGALIDPEHATPVMLAEGKLKSKVDIHHALHNVPFHSLYYDEEA
jgi:hypothetical protein